MVNITRTENQVGQTLANMTCFACTIRNMLGLDDIIHRDGTSLDDRDLVIIQKYGTVFEAEGKKVLTVQDIIGGVYIIDK